MVCPRPQHGDRVLYNPIQTECFCPLNGRLLSQGCTYPLGDPGLSDRLNMSAGARWWPQQQPSIISVALFSLIIQKGKQKSHLKMQLVLFQYNKESPGSLLFFKWHYNVCFVLFSSLLSSFLSRGPSDLTGLRGENYNDSFVYICPSGNLMWWKYYQNIKLEALNIILCSIWNQTQDTNIWDPRSPQ